MLLSCWSLLFLNFSVLTPLVLENDIHKYSTGEIETGTFFEFFFEISSNTGYSPEPSRINFILTYCIGGFIGLLISKKAVWKNKKLRTTLNKANA